MTEDDDGSFVDMGRVHMCGVRNLFFVYDGIIIMNEDRH